MKYHCLYFTLFTLLTNLQVIPGSEPVNNTSPLTHDRSDLIHDPEALRTLRRGIDQIYNNEFTKAEKTLDTLDLKYSNHPASSLFEGLTIYWKYFPLTEGHPGFDEFHHAMQESWERSDSLKHLTVNTETTNSESLNSEPASRKSTNTESLNRESLITEPAYRDNPAGNKFSAYEIEGVFFELVSRAFLVMTYADNGKSSRAITHFPTIYRDILKGMEMEEQFGEFMFITGLYNYYREAFPEAYPVYRAPLVFFRKGNKAEGLNTLRRASTETEFMRVEATLFLSLIQINFENNPDSSLYYTSLLHKTYPGNAYFHAKFTEMLLINGEYKKALIEIEKLRNGDSYNRMKAAIYRGIYEEKHTQSPEKAKQFYEEGLRLSRAFGERANYSKAYAYIGLSRYYKNRDDNKRAREYYKKAKNSSGYEYVFR